MGATSIAISWTWDDTDFSGNNTGDACAEFDTDKDGKVELRSVRRDRWPPASYQYTTFWTCSDGAATKCTSPSSDTSLPNAGKQTGIFGISQVQDPFGLGGIAFDANHSTDGGVCDGNPLCNSKDTQAAGTIQLADFGGATAKLINVCSHESASPTSNPEELHLRAQQRILDDHQECQPQ